MKASADKNDTPGGEFITSYELARRLNKGLRTIERWTQRNWVPHYKIGRSVRFKWSEVEAALQEICRVCPEKNPGRLSNGSTLLNSSHRPQQPITRTRTRTRRTTL